MIATWHPNYVFNISFIQFFPDRLNIPRIVFQNIAERELALLVIFLRVVTYGIYSSYHFVTFRSSSSTLCWKRVEIFVAATATARSDTPAIRKTTYLLPSSFLMFAVLLRLGLKPSVSTTGTEWRQLLLTRFF